MLGKGTSNPGHSWCALLTSIFQANISRCSPHLLVLPWCWVVVWFSQGNTSQIVVQISALGLRCSWACPTAHSCLQRFPNTKATFPCPLGTSALQHPSVTSHCPWPVEVAPDVSVLCHLGQFYHQAATQGPSITSHPGEPGFPFRFSVTLRLVETPGVRGGLFEFVNAAAEKERSHACDFQTQINEAVLVLMTNANFKWPWACPSTALCLSFPAFIKRLAQPRAPWLWGGCAVGRQLGKAVVGHAPWGLEGQGLVLSSLSAAQEEGIDRCCVQRDRQQVSLGGRFGRDRSSPAWSQQGFHGHRNRDAECKCWCCASSPLWSYIKAQNLVSKCHQPQADSLQRTGVLDVGTLKHLSQQSFRLEKEQFVPD